MHTNGAPIEIEPGCPPELKIAHKTLILGGCTCYHAMVSAEDYILFQYRRVGEYDLWLTDYLLGKAMSLTCAMEADGVEFHAVLRGKGRNSLDKGGHWKKESQGTYNILVNGSMFSMTAFTKPRVRTLDIHVDAATFNQLVRRYPILKPLLAPLEASRPTALFNENKHTHPRLGYLQSKIIELLAAPEAVTTAEAAAAEKMLLERVGEYIEATCDIPADNETSGGFHHADIEGVIKAESCIRENLAFPGVLKMATDCSYISREKLNEGFKIIFGKKPKEFIVGERVDRAKAFVLDDPGATYLEIAMSVGYTDGAYMSRLFHKTVGMGIEEYRRLHLKNKK